MLAEAYSSGVIGLMALVVLILILGPLVAARKASADIKPGSEPEGSYDAAVYRLHRSHQNALEVFGTFAVTSVIAMLVGVAALWVNWLIWATVGLRIVYTYVYLANVGKPAQSVRTFVFVAAWVLHVILAGLVVVAVM